MNKPEIKIEPKTEPKLWAIVMVIVSIIGCCGVLGAALIGTLPDIFSPAQTQTRIVPVTSIIIPSATSQYIVPKSINPSITPTAFVCQYAPKTRVELGGRAKVIEATTRLRSDPKIGNNVIFLLAEGDILEIISGPVCSPRPGRNDSYVFWKVSVPSRSLEGWVAEGDDDFYYIEPTR